MRPFSYALIPVVVLSLSSSCTEYPEEIDRGAVCLSAGDQPDGEARVSVRANSKDCSADHEGASFRCSISVDGDRLHVETVFQDGKDHKDSCGGSLTAHCEVVVPAGTYTIEFDGMTEQFEVPDGDEVCLPPGTEPDEW